MAPSMVMKTALLCTTVFVSPEQTKDRVENNQINVVANRILRDELFITIIIKGYSKLNMRKYSQYSRTECEVLNLCQYFAKNCFIAKG